MTAAATGGRVAAPLGWRVARLVQRRVETPTAQTLVLDVPGLAGAPARAARRRAADRRGRLPGGPVVLAGRAGRRRPDRADRAAGARRRGVAVPDRTSGPRATRWRCADRSAAGSSGGPRRPRRCCSSPAAPGVVPLMAMVRARRAAGSRAPFRLIYSVRTPADVHLRRRAAPPRPRRPRPGRRPTSTPARPPTGWRGEPHRVGLADVNTHGWPAELEPLCYVCGPTGFRGDRRGPAGGAGPPDPAGTDRTVRAHRLTVRGGTR